MQDRLNDFLISPDKLYSNLGDKNIIILDARWSLDHDHCSLKDYQKSHIPTSVFFDLNNFFDHTSKLLHTLPSVEQFKDAVSEIGINNKNKIIIYDEKGFFNSSRVWFMFKLFGHSKVLILNGGFKNWIKKKFPVEKRINVLKKNNYKATSKKKYLINKFEINEIINDESKKYVIVDARSEKRFLGKEPEPRKGIKRGNIKNSINIPYTKIYDDDGLLLPINELKRIFYFENNLKNKKVVNSCGSGITACNIFFVLKILSHNKTFLYDGSWAEWGEVNTAKIF